MSIKVDSGYSAFFSISAVRDYEWQQIIDKLWNKYGIRSTGSKDAEKIKLHDLELKEAEQLGGNTNISVLTVTKNELDKIKNKHKNKKIENNQKEYQNITKGAEILGKQIFMAILIKKEEFDRDNKKKHDNKYQT